MGKTRLIAYAFASMVALSGAASAQTVTGPITQVVPWWNCTFFYVNASSGTPQWFVVQDSNSPNGPATGNMGSSALAQKYAGTDVVIYAGGSTPLCDNSWASPIGWWTFQ